MDLTSFEYGSTLFPNFNEASVVEWDWLERPTLLPRDTALIGAPDAEWDSLLNDMPFGSITAEEIADNVSLQLVSNEVGGHGCESLPGTQDFTLLMNEETFNLNQQTITLVSQLTSDDLSLGNDEGRLEPGKIVLSHVNENGSITPLPLNLDKFFPSIVDWLSDAICFSDTQRCENRISLTELVKRKGEFKLMSRSTSQGTQTEEVQEEGGEKRKESMTPPCDYDNYYSRLPSYMHDSICNKENYLLSSPNLMCAFNEGKQPKSPRTFAEFMERKRKCVVTSPESGVGSSMTECDALTPQSLVHVADNGTEWLDRVNRKCGEYRHKRDFCEPRPKLRQRSGSYSSCDRSPSPKKRSKRERFNTERSPSHRKRRGRHDFIKRQHQQIHPDANVMSLEYEHERTNTLYVGNISTTLTVESLRKRFATFGHIEKIKMFPRDEGESYAFIIFQHSQSAFDAYDHVNDNPKLPKYKLSFGYRRAFCQTAYEDLDHMPSNAQTFQSTALDYNTMLAQEYFRSNHH